ncbi:MAG: hypothetical protein NC388_07150 [Clostridium sp.]|nr:hypothetical protein [Clostridium sp.]
MDFRLFFCKTLWMLIVPVVLFLTGYEWAYRKLDNSYSLKDRGMKIHGDSIEILILGNSHTFFGLDPAYFSRPAFNAANVSQDFRHNHFIFFRYTTRMPRLRTVIIPLSFSSLWELLEREGDSWRMRKYAIYMHDTSVPWNKPEWHFEFMSVGNHSLWDALKGKDLLQCTPCGAHTGNRMEDRDPDWQETWTGPVGRHSHFLKKDRQTLTDIESRNRRYLEEVITSCQKRNIEVLLITTPTWHTYYEHLNRPQYEAMQAYARQLTEQHGIRYLNLMRDNRFTEDDFFDTDHLNEHGAAKLSRLINASSIPY